MELNGNCAPVYFGAQCIGLNLFENATFMGYGLDTSYNVIMNKTITLTTDQYNEWKKCDDNYIIRLVAEAIQNETQPVVQPVVDPELEQEIKQTVDNWVDPKV